MDKLRFNTSRHDARVSSTKEEEQKAQAMKIFGRHYDTWKRSLRKKSGMSPPELRDKLLDLRNIITKEMQKEGLEEWVSFSLKLLDEKIAAIDTVMIAGRNKIVRYEPNLELEKGQKSWTDEATFQTEAELIAIPWIKTVGEKAGFFGFVLEGQKLLALFEDGEHVPVGVVSCGIGLERIPGIEDYRKALLASEAAQATAKPTGSPTTGGPDASPG